MKTFLLTFCALLPLIASQMPMFQVQHYLSQSNATVREAFVTDLSQFGAPFSLEIILFKSAEGVTGSGEVEADFSLFATSTSTEDLLDFDGEELRWNTGSTAASSNRTSATIRHPNCYSLLRGESALNNLRMEFTSELSDLTNYNPASIIYTQYMVLAQRIDVAADGSTQSRQTSAYAAQTPLTLVVGSPAQNDQAVYDVTINLSSSTGMLPFSLARIGGPGFCVDDDDLTSDDETRLATIPSGSSYSLLLSNVVAGNWGLFLDSMTGMRNQTYSISASAALKSQDRSGWSCSRFGYCSLTSTGTRTISEGTTTVNNPTVIGDDRNASSQSVVGLLLIVALVFVAYF